jgi:hypothetical protein
LGKRNRRERRAHQQERAAVAGDVGLLRTLAEKDPRLAAAAVQRALVAGTTDPEQAAELDALAVGLAGTLRRRGELAPALALAAAGRRRTPAFRIEEALAAFASGRDEIAAQIAADAPDVDAALGPLLHAVRGEVAAAPARSTAPADLRALHAVARAVAHVVRGEPAEAAGILKRIPVAARRQALGEEIRDAAELTILDRSFEALEALCDSEHVTAEVRRTAAAEAVLDAEDLAEPPAPLAADPGLRARLVRAQIAAATSPAAIVDVVRRVGVDVFDAPQRAAAALYHGFALVHADSEAAERSFDRSIQLGGDMIEALRGKMLAAARPPGVRRDERSARRLASAADRFAHALARKPLGGPLAAYAGSIAAGAWLDVPDPRAAIASIARARPFAGGKLVDDLDLHEVDATAHGDLEGAERRVDVVLARSPGNRKAWELKAELAFAQGDRERSEAIILEAAATTKDPLFMTRARAVRTRRGTVVPFEGLVPGAASAGTLAAELALATTQAVYPFSLAASHRAALDPAARLAFDAASLAIAVRRGALAASEARLREALVTWRTSPKDLHRLVAVAVRAGLADLVPAAAVALGDDVLAVRACAEALGAAGEAQGVRRLLPAFAASLTRQDVTIFKDLARSGQQLRQAGIPDPEAAVRELDLALAPDFSLADFLRVAESPASARDDDEEDEDDALPDDLLGSLLDTFGVSGRHIPEDARRQANKKLDALLRSGRSAGATASEIAKVLLGLGILPPEPSDLPRPKKR